MNRLTKGATSALGMAGLAVALLMVSLFATGTATITLLAVSAALIVAAFASAALAVARLPRERVVRPDLRMLERTGRRAAA